MTYIIVGNVRFQVKGVSGIKNVLTESEVPSQEFNVFKSSEVQFEIFDSSRQENEPPRLILSPEK
jgi:hypothetical protein